MDLTLTIPAGIAASAVTVLCSQLVRARILETNSRRKAFDAHVKECDQRRAVHASLEEKVLGLEKRTEQGFNDVRNQLHEISENMRRLAR